MPSKPRWKEGALKILPPRRKRWRKDSLKLTIEEEIRQFQDYMNFTRPSPKWYQPHMPWYDHQWRLQEDSSTSSSSSSQTATKKRQKDLKELNALLTQMITERNRAKSD